MPDFKDRTLRSDAVGARTEESAFRVQMSEKASSQEHV